MLPILIGCRQVCAQVVRGAGRLGTVQPNQVEWEKMQDFTMGYIDRSGSYERARLWDGRPAHDPHTGARTPDNERSFADAVEDHGMAGLRPLLTLKNREDDGLIFRQGVKFGSLARLLAAKGIQHEADCLADYERQGKSVLKVPDRGRGEKFEAWVERVGNPLDRDYDVMHQMPLLAPGCPRYRRLSPPRGGWGNRTDFI